MKKYICLTIALCLSVTLMGCHTVPNIEYVPQTTEPTTEPQTTATESTEETIFTVTQLPLISVSLPRTTQTTYADDDVIIYEKIGQNIALTVPDPEIAHKIIVDFLQTTDTSDISDDRITYAEQSYREHPNNFLPYRSGYTFSPARHDPTILSMFGSYSEFSGGVHGEYVFTSVSYELTSGNRLSLTDILVPDPDVDVLCQQVLESLYEVKNTKALFDNYENTVIQHFKRPPAQITNWYLSNTGLCFFFSPYEIGPFSSMEIVAEVPYEELIGTLNEAYFPDERELATGALFVKKFTENSLTQFNQFTELSFQGGSTKSLLYTDALVYDIRIEYGTWSYDGSEFTPQYTAFSAYTLTPGDAIVVESEASDTQPAIRISYNSNGETIYNYLSTQNGIPQLIP